MGGHGFPRLYTGKIAERLLQLHSAGLLYHYTLSWPEFKKKIQCNKKLFLDYQKYMYDDSGSTSAIQVDLISHLNLSIDNR